MTDPNTEITPEHTAMDLIIRTSDRLSSLRVQLTNVYDELNHAKHEPDEPDLVDLDALATRLFDIASRIEQAARILAGELW